MIEFKCPGCGRAFSVSADYAGRKANCKGCGTSIVVPSGSTVPRTSPPTVAATASPPPPATREGATDLPSPPTPSAPAGGVQRIPMRTRRLIADAKQMAEAFADFPAIKARPVTGDPPEAYHVEYAVRGLERGKGNKPIPREQHLVEIRLTSGYPRQGPQCKMLTPVFHPNIDPTTICVGDHWTAGERLVDLTVRIGEMLAYQAFNLQSPLDAEAAMWADLNQRSLPLDPRALRPRDT